MVAKFKLNLIVGFTIMLITLYLIWAHRVWEWTGNLLLLGAIVLIVRALLVKEKKPAKLLEFAIKSLIVSYVVVSVIWFINLTVISSWYYAYLNAELLINILIFDILPLALLPVAVAVLIYGVFKIRLKAWEFFLACWYTATFAVFTIYQVWWTLFVRPYLPEFYYSSSAGAIVMFMGLVLLALLIAGTLTVFYVRLKKKSDEPTTH